MPRLTIEEFSKRIASKDFCRIAWFENELYLFDSITLQDFREGFITPNFPEKYIDITAYIISCSGEGNLLHPYSISTLPGDSRPISIEDLPKEFLTSLMLLGFTV